MSLKLALTEHKKYEELELHVRPAVCEGMSGRRGQEGCRENIRKTEPQEQNELLPEIQGDNFTPDILSNKHFLKLIRWLALCFLKMEKLNYLVWKGCFRST